MLKYTILGFCLLILTACQKSDSSFGVNDLYGHWTYLNWSTGSSPTSVSATFRVHFGVRAGGGYTDLTPDNDWGYTSGDHVFRDLTSDGHAISGEILAQYDQGARQEWLPVTLKQLDEDQIEVHTTCTDCAFETPFILWRNERSSWFKK